MSYKLIDHNRETEKDGLDSKAEAEEKKQDMISLGASPEDLEIVQEDTVEAEVVEHTEDAPETEPQEAEIIDPTEQLAKDPIEWLEGKNTDFVNTIKGKPAISKHGFRYIQAQFGIVTESEVVETFENPKGCIVWAKAELPDGQSAEAHGEGYRDESDVDDNEFVRYADTRAKNRAISDLTSAGALAVSELGGEQ